MKNDETAATGRFWEEMSPSLCRLVDAETDEVLALVEETIAGVRRRGSHNSTNIMRADVYICGVLTASYRSLATAKAGAERLVADRRG